MLHRSFADELMKIARIVALTGDSGAGKTTLSRRLDTKFDKIIHGDTWYVKNEGGKRRVYEKTPEEKKRIYARRMREAMSVHNRGGNVLIEGTPNVIMKHPGLVEKADEIIHIKVPASTRLRSVMKRTVEQNKLNLRPQDVPWVTQEFKEQLSASPRLQQQAADKGKLSLVSRDGGYRKFGLEPLRGPIDVGKAIR